MISRRFRRGSYGHARRGLGADLPAPVHLVRTIPRNSGRHSAARCKRGRCGLADRARAGWHPAPDHREILSIAAARLLGCRPDAVDDRSEQTGDGGSAWRSAGIRRDSDLCSTRSRPSPEARRDRGQAGRWRGLPGHPVVSQLAPNCAPGCKTIRIRIGYFQPYVRGEARSLSMLCCDGRARVLACNRQKVRIDDGAFRFDGVSVNAVPDREGRYALNSRSRIARALPGLWGYCGVDFIETDDGTGGDRSQSATDDFLCRIAPGDRDESRATRARTARLARNVASDASNRAQSKWRLPMPSDIVLGWDIGRRAPQGGGGRSQRQGHAGRAVAVSAVAGTGASRRRGFRRTRQRCPTPNCMRSP